MSILDQFSYKQKAEYRNFLIGNGIFEIPKKGDNGVVFTCLTENFLTELPQIYCDFAKNERYSGISFGSDEDSTVLCFLEAIERVQLVLPEMKKAVSASDGLPVYHPFELTNLIKENKNLNYFRLKNDVDKKEILIPEPSLFHTSDKEIPSLANSNGMACGLTAEQAFKFASNELIERKLYAKWWNGGIRDVREVSKELIGTILGHPLMEKVLDSCQELRVFELNDGGLTCYMATSYSIEQTFYCYGASVHEDPYTAIKKSVSELVQVQVNNIIYFSKLQKYPFLTPLTHGIRSRLNRLLSNVSTEEAFSRDLNLKNYLKAYRSQLYYFDFEIESFPFSVVKLFDLESTSEGIIVD